MPHLRELERLEIELSSHFEQKEKAYVRVLALYALGMAITMHCGQTMIVELWHQLLNIKHNTLRQRLREFTYEKARKRGSQRLELDVKTCFAPLLRWILSKFAADQRQLVLAFDVTYLGGRFRILSVSVVVAGCGIPVAWQVQRPNEKGEWNAIWRRLLERLQPAIPDTWQVYVLCDAGLYSRTMYRYITQHLKWHPYLRMSTAQGHCRHANGQWFPLKQLASKGMQPIAYTDLVCFKATPLTGVTVLVEWDATYDEPCVVVTDLPPAQTSFVTYHLRYWIEAGFKDLKRGGLHWEQTKMTCPRRVERLWLVMSVALCYLMSQALAASDPIPDIGASLRRPRRLSLPKLGWIQLLVRLITNSPANAEKVFVYDPHHLPPLLNTYP